MANNIISFKDYLCSLKKNEINNIVVNYNKLAVIFNEQKLNTKKVKKDDAISSLLDNKRKYLNYILSTFDLNDCNELSKGLLSKSLQKFLMDFNVLNKVGVVYQEFEKDINELLKDKELIKKIKQLDTIKNYIHGLIVAYGVIDINYLKEVLGNYCDIEEVISILKLRGNNNYIIEKDRIISSLLTNEKRINKYYKNDNYKKFSLKDIKMLGDNKYHYNLKSYKKLIGLLKNYYVFKRKDIKFIDENIMIPYLYTSINEESSAKDSLNKKLEEYFEFRKDNLKDRIFKEIDEIRNNFPLWEYRGYSKKEVNNNE